ncbi:unnamed protein product [Allacma fusca]|uniref:Secreted protein n=1 Tax=Allacma fusca TaxID=39272 RepID=A0A8J2KFU2_9HEXA|nr:unnamed protein product [Allacma fusca]
MKTCWAKVHCFNFLQLLWQCQSPSLHGSWTVTRDRYMSYLEEENEVEGCVVVVWMCNNFEAFPSSSRGGS